MFKIKTLVLDPINEEILNKAKDELEIIEKKQIREEDYSDAQAIIVRAHKIDKIMIDNMPNLKIISKHGIGTDNIDIEYATQKEVLVTNTPEANIESVAEMAIALMLTSSRHILKAYKGIINNTIEGISPSNLTGIELSKKTLGLVGLGKIGKLIGTKMKLAFNMKVIVYDPFVNEKACNDLEFEKIEELEDLLKISDVVNISIPLTKDTENLVTIEKLQLMKKSSILINTSRGKIINEEDLYYALKTNTISSAAMDAFANEPLTNQNPLLSLENFIGTPHNGANTLDALKEMAKQSINEIIRFKKNAPLLNPIN